MRACQVTSVPAVGCYEGTSTPPRRVSSQLSANSYNTEVFLLIAGGCGKTRLGCHSEESAILIGGRRGISHWLENTQSEIPLPRLRDPNDSLQGSFRSLLEAEDFTPDFGHQPKTH